MILPLSVATSDHPNPTHDRQVFYYAIPSDDTGIQALFWTSDANPTMYVRVNGMSFSKYSGNDYLSNEGVTLSGADGAQSGANTVISLSCSPPVDTYGASRIPGVSIVDTGHCGGVLEVFSFADLVAMNLRPVTVTNATISISANGSAIVSPSVRYFRFLPPPGSTGVSLSLACDPGVDASSMDMFVSLYTADGWPSPGTGRWSTVSLTPSMGRRGDSGKTILILDSEFVDDFYTIALTCSTPFAPCDGFLVASGIVDLQAGASVSASVPYLGVQYFRFQLSSDTDTIATVAATADMNDGDVNIFVSAHPFSKPPRYFPDLPTSSSSTDAPGLSCPDCEWKGFISGISIRSTSITVSHLSLYYARTLWIAASCQVGAASFSINAVSYEAVDAGAVYARGQPPESYTYYLGSEAVAASAEAAESRGLTFNARIALNSGQPGSAALLGGSVNKFYPAVADSFEGISVPGITAGMQGVLRQDYLVGSPVARQMIVGVHSGYSGVSEADMSSGAYKASLNAGTSGSGPIQHRRYLQAADAAALANPVLLFAPSGGSAVVIPLEAFSSGVWSLAANCSAASLFVPVAACARITASSPALGLSGSSTTFLRLRIPARVSVQTSIIAAPRTESVAQDAPYSVLLRVGSLPDPTSASTPQLGSGVSFSVPNCLYSPVDAYFAGAFVLN